MFCPPSETASLRFPATSCRALTACGFGTLTFILSEMSRLCREQGGMRSDSVSKVSCSE